MHEIFQIRSALSSLIDEAGLPYGVDYKVKSGIKETGYYLSVTNGEQLNGLKLAFERSGMPAYCELYDTQDEEFPILIGAACTGGFHPDSTYCKLTIGSAQNEQPQKLRLHARFENLTPKIFHPRQQKHIMAANDTLQTLSLHNLTLHYLEQRRPKLVRALRLCCDKSFKKGLSHPQS